MAIFGRATTGYNQMKSREILLVVALAGGLLVACDEKSVPNAMVNAKPVSTQYAIPKQPAIASAVSAQERGADVTHMPVEIHTPRQCVAWQQRFTEKVALFNRPTEIASDNSNLYVVDRDGITIRKIDLATGIVSTLAGSGKEGIADGIGPAASFNRLKGLAIVGNDLYAVDSFNQRIRKIELATGNVSSFAGSGKNGATDGVGSNASFGFPKGIVAVGNNLYVPEWENRTIRKIEIASGMVTTLAGAAGRQHGMSDGIGPAASFSQPSGMTTDGKNLYVLDEGNRNIRKIVIDTGQVSTLVSSLTWPRGIAIDEHYLYVSDEFYNSIMKVDIATGQLTTLAGSGKQDTHGSADGIGNAALFYKPAGLVAVGDDLYVSDSYNNKIRKIEIATGQVSTLAGLDEAGASDGACAAFYLPSSGLATVGGNLYVANYGNNTIYRIELNTGAVNAFAGSGSSDMSDGIGAAAAFRYPQGITSDGGNLYVADYSNHLIRKIEIASGKVATLAGSGKPGQADGIGAASSFNYPRSIVSDGGNLYVVDYDNHAIRKIEITTGKVSTLAGSGKEGSKDGIGAAASFNFPRGIAIDGGNLYVADTHNHTIRKIAIASGKVTTLAGTGNAGAADGMGAAASLSYPQNLVVNDGNLYVADYGNHAIRKIVLATGAVTTFAGTGKAGAKDGTGTRATFNQPEGLATDGKNLYVANGRDHTIRKIDLASGAVTTLASAATCSATAQPAGKPQGPRFLRRI